MDSARLPRVRGPTTHHALPSSRSVSRATTSASNRPVLDGYNALERSQSKRKAPSRSSGSETDDDDAAARPPPAESSAYALLSLMASVQQASQASADDCGRTSDAYKTWKATDVAKDARSDHAKKRKPTHTVRKEEISTLHNEVSQLEKRLAFLRGQTIEQSNMTRQAAREVDDNEDPEHPHIPNALLREAIHEQQLSLACARSIVSSFFSSTFALPAHCYIHLTTSRTDRLRTLQAVKPQQLRVARRYALERSRHLDATKPHAATEQFIAASGDACSIRFSMVQFPGSVSVRQVFDAATFYTSNLEISFTDGAGRLTIREDDDETDDPTVTRHRLLTTVQRDLEVEVNIAMFTHFDEDDECGIVSSTFVDRDDLNPYRPLDRVRQDVTAALYITREKGVVVMRRLGHVRIHYNEHRPIGDELAKSLSEGLSMWGDALVKYARQHCGLERA